MMPELPAGDLLQGDISRAADLQQRIVRHGVERLNAPVQQDRQSAKFPQVVLAIFFGHQDSDNLAAKQRYKKPGKQFRNQFHAVLRLKLISKLLPRSEEH